jgi:pentapeptide MXKDX repeat protein
MRKIILATALTLMCSSAFAQGTGPAAQSDTMTKPGMTSSRTDKGSMSNTTTGSSMSKDGMKKDGMNKTIGAESKDGQGMNKGGAMSK